jgi:hypothetical protein
MALAVAFAIGVLGYHVGHFLGDGAEVRRD